jgi:RDD family
MSTLTLGLVRARGSSLFVGPVEIIRFGPPKTARTSVELPIEGGLAVRERGGRLRIAASNGRLTASVEEYRPRLPAPIYVLTQLPFHHTMMRLHLLRERGRLPVPGMPATPADRIAAGAIDAGVCTTVTLLAFKRRRPIALAAIIVGYHIACWSGPGRTVGGLIVRQRVVSVDGSKVSPSQSLVRMLALPFAAMRLRAVHDQIAGTEVISE